MPCLYIGITLAHFHSFGNMPVVIERLKIRQRDSAIKSEHSLINLEDILSKPVALEVLNEDSNA